MHAFSLKWDMDHGTIDFVLPLPPNMRLMISISAFLAWPWDIQLYSMSLDCE